MYQVRRLGLLQACDEVQKQFLAELGIELRIFYLHWRGSPGMGLNGNHVALQLFAQQDIIRNRYVRRPCTMARCVLFMQTQPDICEFLAHARAGLYGRALAYSPRVFPQRRRVSHISATRPATSAAGATGAKIQWHF